MTVQQPIAPAAPQMLETTYHHSAFAQGSLAVRLAATRDGHPCLQAAGEGCVLAEAVLVPGAAHPPGLEAFRFHVGALEEVAMVAVLVEAVFMRMPEAEELLLPEPAELPAASVLATGSSTVGGRLRHVVARRQFYQLPLLWRYQANHAAYPGLRSSLGPEDRLPPLRPPRPAGTLYERWLPELGMALSFRPIERKRDLALFHEWMNAPRVDFYWELAGSEAEHDEYLAKQEADPHIFGVIGSFDGEPAAYFEFYWAKEDRLGPYYEAEDFDRGWHGLIGNKRHLGRPKTLAWFRSLTHYLFLDEPRTRRVVGEPRASHKRMLSYASDTGYVKVKEFDFPHKRAALMCCERETFFREVAL